LHVTAILGLVSLNRTTRITFRKVNIKEEGREDGMRKGGYK
jgi:hypothetical protein